VAQTELPIACTLTPADGRDRVARWAALHDRAHPTSTRDAGRIELRYTAGDGVYDELVALATAEQDCCGFVTWHAKLDGDVPVLTVTAPADQSTALDAMAALLASR
jgi:hypothetical protein